MRRKGTDKALGEPSDQASGPLKVQGPGKGGVGQINHEIVGRAGHEDADTGKDPFADVRAKRPGERRA